MGGKSDKQRAEYLKTLRGKDRAGLRDELAALRREQFNLRMAAASGQPARPDQHGKVRGRIARVKTVLNQQRSAK